MPPRLLRGFEGRISGIKPAQSFDSGSQHTTNRPITGVFATRREPQLIWNAAFPDRHAHNHSSSPPEPEEMPPICSWRLASLLDGIAARMGLV
jgi:hypothetical protein